MGGWRLLVCKRKVMKERNVECNCLNPDSGSQTLVSRTLCLRMLFDIKFTDYDWVQKTLRPCEMYLV